jgi:hypothetical protein
MVVAVQEAWVIWHQYLHYSTYGLQHLLSGILLLQRECHSRPA